MTWWSGSRRMREPKQLTAVALGLLVDRTLSAREEAKGTTRTASDPGGKWQEPEACATCGETGLCARCRGNERSAAAVVTRPSSPGCRSPAAPGHRLSDETSDTTVFT